jgi:hypothetical protein
MILEHSLCLPVLSRDMFSTIARCSICRPTATFTITGNVKVIAMDYNLGEF